MCWSERLPALGIPSVYLVTYEQPTDAEVPEHARLMLAYTDHERAPHRTRMVCVFQHRRSFHKIFFHKVAATVWSLSRFIFRINRLGYVVFEIGPHDGNIYELLRNNLSSALQGAMLFQEIQQARLDAEKADRIKTRLLANVSHEMRTPLNIITGYTQDALQKPEQIWG